MRRRVGRYWMLDPISSGGMATVHLGRLVAEAGFTRVVAIKRIHETLATDPELRAMFLDEARIVGRVRHANVVTTLDVVDKGGELLLVMEYAHGPSLGRIASGLAARDERAPLDIVASIMSDVLEGLHAAHEARDESGHPFGIVHRDVSPENVIVGVDGLARVLDFGVAYAAGRAQRTHPGQVKGKPAYMAPEQALGEEVDRRVDVYAASVMLWELLTGERLFPAASAAGAMLRHVEEIPVAPSRLRPGVDEALDAIVLRGLQKSPADRFPTARAMAEALDAVTERATRAEVCAWLEREERTFFTERDALLARLEGGEPAASTPAPIPRAPTRQRRWPWLVAALVATSLVAFMVHERKPIAAPSAPKTERPRGTRAVPIKLLTPAIDDQTGEPDLEPALTALLRDILNDSSETVTGGLRRATAAARVLKPDGPIDEATWLRAGEQIDAPAVLLGSVRKDASGYIVAVRLVDPRSHAVWLERTTVSPQRDETLGAVADAALATREALGDTSTAEQRRRAGDAFRFTTIAAAAAYGRSAEQTQSGGWDAALREANAAVAADPDFAMGRFAQALAYGNSGRPEDAERAYRAALARIDRLSEANRLLASGLYFTVRHESPKAIEQLRQYTERYPANFGGAMDLANAYFANRDMTAAEQEGRRAYEMSKAPVALANQALYASYAGDFEESVTDASQVIALGGDGTETAIMALAHAQLGLAKTTEAHAAYAQLAKQGATPASRAALGEADIALAEDRPLDAAVMLESAIDVDVRAGAADLAHVKEAVLAESLLRAGRRDQALALADRLSASSHDTTILVMLGRLYAAAHAAPKASAIAKLLDARVDPEARAYGALVRGDVLLESGHAREAIIPLEESRHGIDSWLARFDLGRAYLSLGMVPEAYQELEACTKRHGEALALFLDDVPTFRYWPLAVAQAARAKEDLKAGR